MKKQSASALIVALFVMAIVAIAATAMSVRLQIDVRKTQLTLAADKLYLTAQAVPIWAQSILMKNASGNSKNKIDTIPLKFPLKNLNNYPIDATLYDAQARFNVNNLALDKSKNRKQFGLITGFAKLISAVAPQYSANQAIDIALNIADHIGHQRTTKANPLYLLSSITELRLVPGVTPKLLTDLSPFIIALPEKTSININTAPAEVLLMLTPELTLADTKRFVTQRNARSGFNTMNEFQQSEFSKTFAPANYKTLELSTQSQYFLSYAHLTKENQSLLLIDCIKREVINKKTQTKILWESRGSL